ncbi:hypothetical protein JCM10207_002162 [Rhodosporidiobolus poonsookiae]
MEVDVDDPPLQQLDSNPPPAVASGLPSPSAAVDPPQDTLPPLPLPPPPGGFGPGHGHGLGKAPAPAPTPLTPSLSPRSTAALTLPHLSAILNSPVDPAHPALPSRTGAEEDIDFASTVPPSSASSSARGSLPSGVPAPFDPAAAREPSDLRQLAILQTLLARQQHHQHAHGSVSAPFLPYSSAAPSPSGVELGFAPPHPPPPPSFHLPPALPHAPPPTPALPLYGPSASSPTLTTGILSAAAPAGEGDMPPTSHRWHTSLEGLNHVDPSAASGGGGGGSAAWLDALPSPALRDLTADELLAAQASLDLWASTPFTPHQQHAPPPASLPAHAPPPPASLDWSALYPQPATPSAQGASTLSALYARYGHFPSPSSSAAPLLSTSLSASASAPVSPPSLSPPTTSSGRRRTSRANAGARGRAAFAAESNASGSGSDDGSGGGAGTGAGAGEDDGMGMVGGRKVPREMMTSEEIEEDKRRRNTEASARFRAKKKMRDQALQETTAQLRNRVASLEKEKESLSNENRWLRDIVSEKAEVQPGLLDVLRRPSVSER